jgi:MinD-like ATPase involved in chromosome partitioning or flagellar assembly
VKPFTVLLSGPGVEPLAADVAEFADVWLCASAEELREQLRGRRWSAVVLDGNQQPDRDLLRVCREAGAPALVLDPQRLTDWDSMGATAVTSSAEALETLRFHRAAASGEGGPPGSAEFLPAGPLIAVTGPGGTGASTVAAALAQGMAAIQAPVLLVDLVRNAEQHVLHQLASDAPGIAEVVEAHRVRLPSADSLRSIATAVPGRGYSVIGGLRRAVAWSALQPAALATAVENLRRAYRVVVADVDADLEDEADTGSPDVEERNSMARHAFAVAAASVVVVRPGLKGTHSALRVVTALWTHGVDPGRTVAAIVGARAEDRARLQEGLRALGADGCRAISLPSVEIEALLVHGLPLPASVVDPLAETLTPYLAGAGPMRPAEAVQVRPGSLGSATSDSAD